MATNESNDSVQTPDLLTTLRGKSYVVEQPFTSNLPAVGGLLVRFRNLWNNISTTWYIRPLLQQQNDFNHLIVNHFEQLEIAIGTIRADLEKLNARCDELSERLIEEDKDMTGLAREYGELSYAVVRLEKELRQFKQERSDHVQIPTDTQR